MEIQHSGIEIENKNIIVLRQKKKNTSKKVVVDSIVVVILDLRYSFVFIANNWNPRHVIPKVINPHIIFMGKELELLT